MNASTEPAKVLIAEDQEHVREALAMLLRGQHEVTMCASPQEAIAAAELTAFEIALVDMNYHRDSTSGIEGLELIQKLRDVDSTLPVIALTAWGNVDLAVSAMKAGASDFIEKPWRNDSLIEKVQSLTSRAQRLRSSQRIHNYEREDAHQLQTRIVPRRHVVAGAVEVYGESLPAGVVGGDYFGVWQPTPDKLHLCIADVSGKGTPGALIAAMLYASVSTLSSSGSTPEMILREVESILRDQLGDGHYLTILYASLDVNTMLLEYVNAGHCPPILRHADGTTERLDATRPVMGLLFEADYAPRRLKLRHGDRLALYTDGITEATSETDDEFGTDRLTALLDQTGQTELSEQHRQMVAAVRKYADRGMTDDATLVLVSVADAEPRAANRSEAFAAEVQNPSR